mmetsp:Transcript_113217/g.283460  ORF Transcript_113217/g.283460 Transcript_113217/m.283460 type:complete len:460 (+) Transcript_113217:105-1484(+)
MAAAAGEGSRAPLLFDPHLVVRRLPGVHEVHGVIGSGNSGYAFCCTVDVETSSDAKTRRTSVVRLVENTAAHHNQEVQRFMKLSHPNLVQLYKVVLGQPDAYYFEFCAGGSIAKAINSLDGMSQWSKLLLWQRARVALDLAIAIEFLHDHGIAHRNVTLKNCFFEERFDANGNLGVDSPLPKAKLGYLGVSCTNAVYLTTRGLGTVRSMAPEVISSNNYGAAADIFAFAIVLSELVTQVVPYSSFRCTAAALALAVCRGLRPDLDSPILTDGSRGAQLMKALIKDLWAEDPATRPPATRLVAHLTDLAKPGIESSTPMASGVATFSASASAPAPATPSPRGASSEDFGASGVCILGQPHIFAETTSTTPRAGGGCCRRRVSFCSDAGRETFRGQAALEQGEGHFGTSALYRSQPQPSSPRGGGQVAESVAEAKNVCAQDGRRRSPDDPEEAEDNWVKIM